MTVCPECLTRQRQGGCLTHRLQRGDVYFHTRRDYHGRGEFLINDCGQKRWTRGWADWRGYCKRNRLIELADCGGVSGMETMRKQAIKRKSERLREAIPKAIDQAINKSRLNTYFDRRVLGGQRPTRTEMKEDFKKYRRMKHKEKECLNA